MEYAIGFKTVLEIYNKMVKQELFETAVGFTYLKELQEYLIQNPSINNSDILPISVTHPVLEESLRKKLKDFCKKQGERKEGVKKKRMDTAKNMRSRYLYL